MDPTPPQSPEDPAAALAFYDELMDMLLDARTEAGICETRSDVATLLVNLIAERAGRHEPG